MIDRQDFLARFERVRRAGADDYTCRCPAHADDDPSLSIRFDPDGIILIHCHAGCAPADVLGAVGLTMGALYPDSALYRESWGGGRHRYQARTRACVEQRLRAEETVLACARGARARGERLSPRDLERERQAFLEARRLRAELEEMV
jgi:hypothetical protein